LAVEENEADAAIAEIGIRLRTIHFVNQRERLAGKSALVVKYFAPTLVRAGRFYHTDAGDGARVHQWIDRPVVVEPNRDNGVERQAGRFDANVGQHFVFAGFLDDLREGENLGAGLNRERIIGIAGDIHFPVHRGDGDAEEIGVNTGEVGN